MSAILSLLRSSLSNESPLASSVRHLSSLDKLELAQDFEANDDEIKFTLTESLSRVEEKERFLAMRIARYKSLMEERVLKMQCNDTQEDVENADTRLGALRASLSEVEKIHKDILVELEKLRRKVEHLEEQRDDVQAKRNECQDCMLALGSYELT